MINRPFVGVGMILRNCRDEILMGKRLGAHGAGTWSFPGGHLELHESPELCAYRELQEETGIELNDSIPIKPVGFTNDYFPEVAKQYVTLFMQANICNTYCAEPCIMEPKKCSEWRWFLIPPVELFPPVSSLLKFYNPWTGNRHA